MQNTAGTTEHPGGTKLLVTIVVVLLAIGAVAWWLASRNAPPAGQQPGGQQPGTPEVTLPPLPEKIYDVSGTITKVGNGSFTISARIRTDKDTVAEGFRDATLTVRFDDMTKFELRAAYAGDGKVPATTPASASDLKVGQPVDVRSRENIRSAESFVAGQVTIKSVPKQ